MSVKTEKYYRGLILDAKEFNDPEDIADFIFAEYKQNKEDNPRFKIKFIETLEKVKKEVDEFRLKLIQSDKKNKYLNPDGTKKTKSDYNHLFFPIYLQDQNSNILPDLTKAFKTILPAYYKNKVCKNQLLVIEKAVPFLNLRIGDSETITEDEINPNFQSSAQKIAWLYELGVTDAIINQCKEGDIIVFRRVAMIINSFTGINKDTIRKCLEAIYLPNSSNKRNNPLNNSSTILYIAELRGKFKLNKEKKPR